MTAPQDPNQQPQFPQDQPFPGQQFAPGQFAPGQFPAGQFPPGQFPPAPAPAKKNKVLIFSLIGVAVVAVIALVVVLVWQPWKDDVLTAELDRGITVEVTVPDGWQASREDSDGLVGVLMTPEGESRSADDLQQAMNDLSRGKSDVKDVHMIVIYADSCDTDNDTNWKLGKSLKETEGEAKIQGQSMIKRLEDRNCVAVYSIDAGSKSVSSDATDLVRAMAKDDSITATFDVERSKEARSSR